jgi:hypothetical protein
MTGALEVNGFLEDPNGARRAFHLRISAPIKTEGEDDYFCVVHSPALFSQDKKIFGADETQARELALSFVKSLLENARLVDHNGSEIELA